MEKERVTLAADEAVKLFKDNPDWSYKRAIEKAKELILDGDTNKEYRRPN